MTTAKKKKQQETTKSKHTHHRRKPRKELTGRHDDLTHGFVLNNIHDITRFQNQELSKGTGNEMLVRSHGSVRETKVTMIQDRISRNERIDRVLKKQKKGFEAYVTPLGKVKFRKISTDDKAGVATTGSSNDLQEPLIEDEESGESKI